jgi:WD40 repeat protein
MDNKQSGTRNFPRIRLIADLMKGVKGNHGITGLCFTTTGRIVASTWTQNGYLMEKEIHGTAERTSSPPGTRIQSLAVSPTSGILAYIVKNDIIFLDKQRLVVGRGNLKRTAPKQPRPQTSLAFTPDGMFLRVLDTNGHLSAISPNGK